MTVHAATVRRSLTKSFAVTSAFALCVAAVGVQPAYAQRGGGVTGGVGGNQGAGNTANRSEAGQVNTAAGTSDQISRDFSDGLIGSGGTASRIDGNANASNRANANFQGLNRQRATQQQPQGSPVRPRLVIGFDTARATGAPFTYATRAVSQRALSKATPGVMFNVSADGTAFMQGRVDTERGRKLAEALVRLEPGVRRVTNNIVVDNIAPPLP